MQAISVTPTRRILLPVSMMVLNHGFLTCDATEKFNQQKVRVQGNNQLVIKQMNRECIARAQAHIFQNADDLRKRLLSRIISFSHIDRDSNLCADYLANATTDTKKIINYVILDRLQLVINHLKVRLLGT